VQCASSRGQCPAELAARPKSPPALAASLQGNVFINQYLIIKDVGKGSHGTVKLCLNTEDETLYAMKVGGRRCLCCCWWGAAVRGAGCRSSAARDHI
jgi:hypothetical protein